MWRIKNEYLFTTSIILFFSVLISPTRSISFPDEFKKIRQRQQQQQQLERQKYNLLVVTPTSLNDDDYVVNYDSEQTSEKNTNPNFERPSSSLQIEKNSGNDVRRMKNSYKNMESLKNQQQIYNQLLVKLSTNPLKNRIHQYSSKRHVLPAEGLENMTPICECNTKVSRVKVNFEPSEESKNWRYYYLYHLPRMRRECSKCKYNRRSESNIAANEEGSDDTFITPRNRREPDLSIMTHITLLRQKLLNEINRQNFRESEARIAQAVADLRGSG